MGWQALVDHSGQPTGEVVGDQAWDIMGAAFEKVITLYKAERGRPPTEDELQSVVEFTFPRSDDLTSPADLARQKTAPSGPVTVLTPDTWLGRFGKTGEKTV